MPHLLRRFISGYPLWISLLKRLADMWKFKKTGRWKSKEKEWMGLFREAVQFNADYVSSSQDVTY
jgi:hypothetical protein